MSEREDLMRAAGRIICPLCTSKACEGRRECKEVQEWIEEKMVKENTNA